MSNFMRLLYVTSKQTPWFESQDAAFTEKAEGFAKKAQAFAKKAEGFSKKAEGFSKKAEAFAKKAEGLLARAQGDYAAWRIPSRSRCIGHRKRVSHQHERRHNFCGMKRSIFCGIINKYFPRESKIYALVPCRKLHGLSAYLLFGWWRDYPLFTLYVGLHPQLNITAMAATHSTGRTGFCRSVPAKMDRF